MWKTAAVGAAALLAGSMFVYAQQPGSPGDAPRETPRTAPGTTPGTTPGMMPGMAHGMMGGWRPSVQDMNAFADARIAALHAGLALNADQEKNWAPFEQALREMAKLRIARMEARQKAMSEQPSQTPANPIDRLQKRADAMATRGAALKRLADAAAPLYQSLDEAQKRRFMLLARFLRPHGPHGPHRAMWRGRDDARPGMEGEFRHHRFGDHDMRDQRRGNDDDYRGPL